MTTTPDDGPESLVPRYLRKLDAGQDAIRADLADLKLRMGSVEQRLSLVERGLTEPSM